MSTTTINPVSPAAATPVLSFENTGAAAEPFLSILDAAASRAAEHHADRDRVTTAAYDDDEHLTEDEPIDDHDATANEAAAPIIVPIETRGIVPIETRGIVPIETRGAQGSTAVSAHVAATTPTGTKPQQANDKSPSNGGADKAATSARVSPAQAAAVAETRPDAGRQSPSAKSGPSDINVQVTNDDVKSKPTTMLSTTETATIKPGEQPETNLRAERYAELRANPTNRLGGEVRLADIGGPPRDAATAAKSGSATAQGTDPAVARLSAATTTVETPAPPVTTANAAGPQQPTVAPATSTTTSAANTSVTSSDTGAPVNATARNAGAASDAARIAAAPRSHPATTARTAEQIAVQIKNGINAGADKIHVRLQPAALGRVDIQLEVGHDQRVQAVIVVEKPETLEILERDARHLHRMLENAGFNTDNDSLTFRQQSSPDERQPNGSSAMTETVEQSEQSAEALVRTSHHDGLLDVEV